MLKEKFYRNFESGCLYWIWIPTRIHNPDQQDPLPPPGSTYIFKVVANSNKLNIQHSGPIEAFAWPDLLLGAQQFYHHGKYLITNFQSITLLRFVERERGSAHRHVVAKNWSILGK